MCYELFGISSEGSDAGKMEWSSAIYNYYSIENEIIPLKPGFFSLLNRDFLESVYYIVNPYTSDFLKALWLLDLEKQIKFIAQFVFVRVAKMLGYGCTQQQIV